MSSRYVPYASRPHRLFAQVFSDVSAAVWIVIWVLVGVAVHSAVASIAAVGRQVQSGANGISENLDSAGSSVHGVPFIGDQLSKPLTAASDAALDLAGAGQSLDHTASWLAWVLALAVAATPILAVAGPWLFLRLRYARRKWTAVTLARTPAGEQLLAMRALANRPLARLATVTADPVGAWRREDPIVVRGLATLELRAAGIRPPW
jgi:hypothetical protein